MKSKSKYDAHALVRERPTLIKALADDPKLSPKKAAARLYPKPWLWKRILLRFQIKNDLYNGRQPNDLKKEHLDEAERSGKFPYRPSDLFLKIYSDVLLCLSRDPMSGVVSPPLMGSSAVMPLSIISVIPDIMRHYAHCIVNAEKQVLLATNYLQPSQSHKITFDALKELSRKVGERGQKEKVVVKLMYDRGNIKQFLHNHVPVLPGSKGWKEVQLPEPSEIPNLDIEVINFHRVLLGTFHAKFMVVDRKLCLLSSNNIQDRPNVEMMIHLEGPVVDSFIDSFLVSWHNPMRPPPPLLPNIASTPPPSTGFRFESDNPYLRDVDIGKAAKAARALLKREQEGDQARRGEMNRRRRQQEQLGLLRGITFGSFTGQSSDVNLDEGAERHGAHKARGEGFQSIVEMMMERQGIGRHRHSHNGAGADAQQQNGDGETPHAEGNGIEPGEKEKGGEAESSDPAQAHPEGGSGDGDSATAVGSQTDVNSSQAGATKKAVDTVEKIRLQNTSVSSTERARSSESGPSERPANSTLPMPSGDDRERDEKRELFDSEAALEKRKRAISEALNVGTIRRTDANIPDAAELEDFRPHVLHRAHDPFPIAVVNRKPHGMPGHQDIRTPQNAAWLAGFRYAQRKIFIQTPTLNASPVVRACIDTAKRGVQVILYLGLGFNDKGESIPFQGGTNQEVVIKMYKELKKVGREKYLEVYWYTGKDQIRPISAIYKSRNCHVKFMVIDDEVGIQGNGNQDTQSWFHSQEMNVLVDSKQICAEWMAALDTNQNTKRFGKVKDDGIWVDEHGRTVSFYDDEVTEREKEKKRDEKRQNSRSRSRSAEAEGRPTQ